MLTHSWSPAGVRLRDEWHVERRSPIVGDPFVRHGSVLLLDVEHHRGIVHQDSDYHVIQKAGKLGKPAISP